MERRSGGSYLLCDNEERVSFLGQEVEDAPDLEGVVVADGQLAQVQVLAAAQCPAHLVELLLVKVVGHLQQEVMESESSVDQVVVRYCAKEEKRMKMLMMAGLYLFMLCNRRTFKKSLEA